jgi:DNA-binding MarR family transcriptional regulator
MREPEKVSFTPNAIRVLALITARPGVTPSEVAAYLDLSLAEAKDAIDEVLLARAEEKR